MAFNIITCYRMNGRQARVYMFALSNKTGPACIFLAKNTILIGGLQCFLSSICAWKRRVISESGGA